MERLVENKVINAHIKKAGGTSMLDFYTQFYGENRVYVYDSDRNGFSTAKNKVVHTHSYGIDRLISYARKYNLLPFLIKLKKKIPDSKQLFVPENMPADWAVIDGHFNPNDIITRLPKAKYVVAAAIRDPLQRAISHYQYWRSWNPDHPTTFKEFIEGEKLRNFQTKSLGNLNPENILLGTTDNLPLFAKRVVEKSLARTVPSLPQVSHLNVNPVKIDSLVQLGVADPHNFLAEFHDANQQDYELFDLAKCQNQAYLEQI